MELWAYSAGCPEMARALTDPEFSKRVDSAVFIAPASSANVPKVALRAMLDFFRMAVQFKPKTPIAWGSKAKEPKSSKKLRDSVRDALGKQLSKKTDFALGFPSEESLPNDQMKLVALEGKHLTPTMPNGATELIEAVKAAHAA